MALILVAQILPLSMAIRIPLYDKRFSWSSGNELACGLRGKGIKSRKSEIFQETGHQPTKRLENGKGTFWVGKNNNNNKNKNKESQKRHTEVRVPASSVK